jgi:hypothetical protein
MVLKSWIALPTVLLAAGWLFSAIGPAARDCLCFSRGAGGLIITGRSPRGTREKSQFFYNSSVKERASHL